jgi:hypothetical protein
MQPNALWIGYVTVEGFAEYGDKDAVVYLCLNGVEGKPNSFSLSEQSIYLDVSQIDDGGNGVHYCRILSARTTLMGGEPPDKEEHLARWNAGRTLETLVKNYLTERGYTVVAGLIANPEGLRLLSGSASFASFDSVIKQYVLREECEPVSVAPSAVPQSAEEGGHYADD